MAIVKARLRLEGSRDYSEGFVLVNTGTSVTLIDSEVANKVGVINTKRKLELTTA